MTAIYLFPGQGSQKIGMGQGLFERFPRYVEEADDILGYSIRRLCLDDPQHCLNLTQYTQPALYVVNALSYFADRDDDPSVKIDYAAGHSLGEYNALLAAQVFDFATGLKLVQKRAWLMSEASLGGMSAVIGLSLVQIQEVFQAAGVDTIDIANMNSPMQIVISGPVADLDRVDPACKAAGAKLIVRLNVSGAFHSRYMHKAAEEFRVFLNQQVFSPLSNSVIANSTAQPYANDAIVDRLAEQIYSPVRWTESMMYLLNTPEPQFKELGPQGVLTKLLKQISL
jgi:malonyl CoA-acyl carrier protein transacylase